MKSILFIVALAFNLNAHAETQVSVEECTGSEVRSLSILLAVESALDNALSAEGSTNFPVVFQSNSKPRICSYKPGQMVVTTRAEVIEYDVKGDNSISGETLCEVTVNADDVSWSATHIRCEVYNIDKSL